MPRRKRKEEDINNLSIKEWIIKELGLKWIFIFIICGLFNFIDY